MLLSDTNRNKGIYTFDQVFGPQEDNFQIYQKAIHPHMDNLKQGYNTSIILYGVTGSGKTHTVFGELGNNRSQDKGIIYYATQQIFKEEKMHLYLSYIEIYNETVTDLLQENSTDLMILERGEGDVHVAGLSQIEVESFQDMVDWIKLGNRRRKMAKTNQNVFSSRSHAII